MSTSLSNQLYNRVLDAVSKHMASYPLADRLSVEKHVNSAQFINDVASIVSGKDYSCAGVLGLCRSLLDEIAGSDAPEDWLNYIYQFTVDMSFPQAREIALKKSLDKACSLYLVVLREICEFQKISNDGTWQSAYPLLFLTDSEREALENPSEYSQFIKAFKDEYIYEMMKLNQEVLGHNTLDHVCGVHHLALSIARQLLALGLPLDLGRVSGAAAGHDIGKYGCKGSELKRVPYLHYYYTDLWFRKHDIVYIRNIALNHSTWDLEIENLPLESLLLIYSDFRVKRNGAGNMHIFSLDESFDIVLGKLDNVNEAKEKRYRRVFAKLKDFEDYMVHLGIRLNGDDTELHGPQRETSEKHYSLMHGDEVVKSLKNLSIYHNINLMYKLRDESSLNTILESARSEKNWKNLREYLRIFEEYSTYLTQKQKLITLKFLYENLIHPEDDIRRHCSELIGALIATFDEEYRKEVPADADVGSPEITSCELLDRYMDAFINPDHRIIPAHRLWIGYGLGTMVASLFLNCKKSMVNSYIRVILKYYSGSLPWKSGARLYLLEAAKFIPASCEEGAAGMLLDFILNILGSDDANLKLSALDALCRILPGLSYGPEQAEQLKSLLVEDIKPSESPAENYLKLKLARTLGAEAQTIDKLESLCCEDRKKISDIFLSNLKTATHRATKKVQVELLLDYSLSKDEGNALYTAMHFCNLIKVSPVEDVRIAAGEALVKLTPHLSLEQRNDIAIELLRALEIEGYQFTKYIPYYLGQIILYLQPIELDEVLDDLIEKIKQSGPQINSLLLKTLGVTVSNYTKYRELFPLDNPSNERRLIRILGILLNGLVNYNLQIKQVAFSVLGKDIFGSRALDLEQKKHIFNLTSKKILTLLTDSKDEELLFLTNSSGLNHMYRFISDYSFFNGKMDLEYPDRIAFFPGTFDPFSLSHKEITKEIRNMGFEVYLAIDEFSWSKRTQPHLIRRDIINMSIADELNIYLFPENIPINIANPCDLATLKQSFPNSKVYIVVGSDVVLHASGYRASKEENSIHHFPHIIFDRHSIHSSEEDDRKLDREIGKLEGEIIRLSLPPQYEDISSTQIRNYIDENRDISILVDPLAQKFIYKNGLYRREPQYKTLVQPVSVDVEIVNELTPTLMEKLACQFFANREEALERLTQFSRKLNPRILLLKDLSAGGRILGFSAFHWVRLSMLFSEFQNNMVSEHIRDNAVGRILVMDGIFAERNPGIENLEQVILTETLTYCLTKDYNYAVFKNAIQSYSSPSMGEILELQGFQRMIFGHEKEPIYIVNMSAPCTLNLDCDTVIKEPFRGLPAVKDAIHRARQRLQRALAGLYPGQLILSFDRNMLHQTLVKKICAENEVDTTVHYPRNLGPAMCVPFGTILNNQVVPNTVTKSMHTEKLFRPDMRSFTIGPFPYYLDLDVQIRMLRSFNRPVILVDDLLNKGYRIKALDPLIKKEGLDVRKIIVGILSGRGKELMDIQNREVDSAYFVPRLKAWFNESSMYPFIGGDSLWRGVYPQWNLIPSINLIMPYTSPTFISDASSEALYHLSCTCIENAIDIITTLEEEYQYYNERALTLDLLGEVINPPRCPDHGNNMMYDLTLNPSGYLYNDLELLKRLQKIIVK
ncbi:MAG: cytidyltransferase [Bacillota bacterium]|nr:cytidyltransferase [Bacillota bacterium]